MSTQDQKLEALMQLLKEVLTDKNQDANLKELAYLKFSGDAAGQGLLWPGKRTKQFIFNSNEDKFFSSESIDLAKERALLINNIKVLDEKELGLTVTKSNLKEVGKLKGLVVDGSMSVGGSLFYDEKSGRLGVGTSQPNAALSIADKNIELVLGCRDSKASIGAYNSVDLELVTDNTARISISAGGNIELGNRNNGPTQVSVHGRLGINVSNVDPRAELHVAGGVKFNDTLYLKGPSAPTSGAYNQGDIVWNSNPKAKSHVGWICTQSGNPGVWNPFGDIR
jgi:hypothetical protein